MTRGWQNWSGAVTCRATPARPDSEAALADLLRAGGPVRVVGAGHSFTPLCETDGTLVSLDAMPGDVLDLSGDVARLQAGASLNSLSRALQERGAAFRNLGDIDVQSLAGALATATHGTGKTLPCLAGELRGLRLMTANGEIVETRGDDDLLRAAQVSLGALGIVLQAEMAVRPAFKLHRIARVEPLAQVLQTAHDNWDSHRNFEFFTLPHCDYAFTIRHQESTGADHVKNHGDDEQSLRQMRWLRNALKRLPGLRRRVLNAAVRRTPEESRIGTSWQLLANIRATRFNEMEYHLPVETGLKALQEVMRAIETHRPEVFFPIEVRMTAGDTGWLSPFQGSARISVAVHAHAPDDFHWMFDLAEPIFRRLGGRPHWGKLHSLGADDLRALYPDFDRFCALRQEMDPQGIFLNAHLRRVFGVQ